MQAVYSYDVGFGNACLVIKGDIAILIDAGSIAYEDRDINSIHQDIAKKICNILQKGGKLIIIITHPHLDHYSMIEDILNNIISLIENFDRNNVRIFIGGVLTNEVIDGTDLSEESEGNMSCGQELLKFFYDNFTLISQGRYYYYSIVPALEVNSVSENVFMANPISTARATEMINSFCGKDIIRLRRVYDDDSKPNRFFSLSAGPNENTVMVGLDFTMQMQGGGGETWSENFALLFMGDAPANNLEEQCITNKIQYLVGNKSIIWYQVPHHGSNRSSEFLWLRHILAKKVYIIVFSTKAGKFEGIPNAEAIIQTFESEKLLCSNPAPQDKNYCAFSAVPSTNSRDVHMYYSDNSRSPQLLSTENNSMQVYGL